MGNATPKRSPPTPRSVHPHVHGERQPASSPPPSPTVHPTYRGTRTLVRQEHLPAVHPHAWGTLHRHRGREPPGRFIPTYMGNAYLRGEDRRLQAVHPHVHGERAGMSLPPSEILGSSPRTWGTQRGRQRQRGSRRFIPTYMGNAVRLTRLRCVHSVHPHVHGERELLSGRRVEINGYPTHRERHAVASLKTGAAGSSPHAWGTRLAMPAHRPIGSSPRTERDRWSRATHTDRFIPIYGERTTLDQRPYTKSGSSPRTWGTQVRDHDLGDHDRFIPTYMGNAARS